MSAGVVMSCSQEGNVTEVNFDRDTVTVKLSRRVGRNAYENAAFELPASEGFMAAGFRAGDMVRVTLERVGR